MNENIKHYLLGSISKPLIISSLFLAIILSYFIFINVLKISFLPIGLNVIAVLFLSFAPLVLVFFLAKLFVRKFELELSEEMIIKKTKNNTKKYLLADISSYLHVIGSGELIVIRFKDGSKIEVVYDLYSRKNFKEDVLRFKEDFKPIAKSLNIPHKGLFENLLQSKSGLLLGVFLLVVIVLFFIYATNRFMLFLMVPLVMSYWIALIKSRKNEQGS